jgi:hypothetical protein
MTATISIYAAQILLGMVAIAPDTPSSPAPA